MHGHAVWPPSSALLFVYVMGRVYIRPFLFGIRCSPTWLFLATSLLLGFQPAALHGRPCRPEGSRKKATLLLGWYPVFIVLAFILQMLVIPLQLLLAQSPFSTYLLAWHLTLLLFGAQRWALCCSSRNSVNRCFGACRTCPCPLWIRAGIILLPIVAVRSADAPCSTAATWFGM